MDRAVGVREHQKECTQIITKQVCPPEQKLRVARQVARKCVARGLWTQEEADAFVAGVRGRMEGVGHE